MSYETVIKNDLKVTGNQTVEGDLVVEGGITGDVTGDLTGNAAGYLTGGLLGAKSLEKAVDYALVAADKASTFIALKMTAASKIYTLGLAAGQIAIVFNSGTESFTVKNIAADTGTVLATTKALLIIGSATADASTVIALN